MGRSVETVQSWHEQLKRGIWPKGLPKPKIPIDVLKAGIFSPTSAIAGALVITSMSINRHKAPRNPPKRRIP